MSLQIVLSHDNYKKIINQSPTMFFPANPIVPVPDDKKVGL